jgi:N-acetylglucosaminylphosphatidylinositol deacetylase
MFFSPAILAHKNNIKIICLSSGDADGLGYIRKTELLKSCKLLGIDSEKITLIQDDNLKDSMQHNWDHDIILPYITDILTGSNIKQVIII